MIIYFSTLSLNNYYYSFVISTKKFNFAAQLSKYIKMATKEEVQKFLYQMKEKVKVFGIIYRDDRGKNTQTLVDLEITPKYRDTVIINLEVQDYSEGPIVDTLYQCGEMWVFGKDVKGQEVYIKITLGKGASALCISFHIAEHPMNYPFK